MTVGAIFYMDIGMAGHNLGKTKALAFVVEYQNWVSVA
jgi:hypothetical protein